MLVFSLILFIKHAWGKLNAETNSYFWNLFFLFLSDRKSLLQEHACLSKAVAEGETFSPWKIVWWQPSISYQTEEAMNCSNQIYIGLPILNQPAVSVSWVNCTYLLNEASEITRWTQNFIKKRHKQRSSEGFWVICLKLYGSVRVGLPIPIPLAGRTLVVGMRIFCF